MALKDTENNDNGTAPVDEIDYGVLPDLLGYQIRRAQLKVFQHFAATLGEFNITPGQLGLLVLISCNPGISQTALARAAGIERSTLGEVVSTLESRGLLSREPPPHDRRSYALTLTEDGERQLARLIPRVHEHERDIASSLTAEEFDTLVQLLHRLAQS